MRDFFHIFYFSFSTVKKTQKSVNLIPAVAAAVVAAAAVAVAAVTAAVAAAVVGAWLSSAFAVAS